MKAFSFLAATNNKENLRGSDSDANSIEMIALIQFNTNYGMAQIPVYLLSREFPKKYCNNMISLSLFDNQI